MLQYGDWHRTWLLPELEMRDALAAGSDEKLRAMLQERFAQPEHDCRRAELWLRAGDVDKALSAVLGAHEKRRQLVSNWIGCEVRPDEREMHIVLSALNDRNMTTTEAARVYLMVTSLYWKTESNMMPIAQ